MARSVLLGGKNKNKTIQEKQTLCADCSATDPEWANINRGILICNDCCSVHRSLGRHVSQIKSCSDKDWHPNAWNLVCALSSGGANSVWEHTLLDPGLKSAAKKKPQPYDPVHPVKADFIRAKHQSLSFIIQQSSGEDRPLSADDDAASERLEEEASQELHSSVRTGNLETSLRLLSQGANPNYFHKGRGNYPLHVAAAAGQIEQVELMLSYGALPHCTDNNGKTAAQVAFGAGYPDLCSRLNEVQYEMVNRLVRYLSDQHTNMVPHSTPSNEYWHITSEKGAADGTFLPSHLLSAFVSGGGSELNRSARSKLVNMPCVLLEELAADLYDEVDRRELESQCAHSNPSSKAGSQSADFCTVPFLPVNPMLSSTRNQARQKLARLKESEICSLVVDLLIEARRRAAITSKPLPSAVPLIESHEQEISTTINQQNTSAASSKHHSGSFFLHSVPKLSTHSSDSISSDPKSDLSVSAFQPKPKPLDRTTPLSLDELLQECSASLATNMDDSFSSNHLPPRGTLHAPQNSKCSSSINLSNTNTAIDALSVDSLNLTDNPCSKPSPANLYLPLSDVSSSGVNSAEATHSGFFLGGSDKGGIHPPLSPESSSSVVHRMNSETDGINPPLSPLGSCRDTPLTPSSASYSETLFPYSSGRVPSGINPPLTPQVSDYYSSTYVPLGSSRSGDGLLFPSHNRVHSGINPPLSIQGSTADYAPLGSVMSGIHPSLSERGCSVRESDATLGPSLYGEVANTLQQISRSHQENPLYRSYDTVNITSDEEEEEGGSLDDGQVGDTEDNSDQAKRKKKSGGEKSRKNVKSVRKRIKDSFGKMRGKKEKYSSGISSGGSNGDASGDDDSSGTFVGSLSSGTKKSELAKSQFAAQLSLSIKQKLGGKQNRLSFRSKEKRRSDSSSNFGMAISPAEARAKSRSLPLKNNLSVTKAQDLHLPEKQRGVSKFVRTLTMPLKMAAQKKQTTSKVLLVSRSQPATPEITRRHKVMQSYTRPQTNVLIGGSGSFSGPSTHIRDPLSTQAGPAGSVKSLMFGSSKDKSSIKHISRPILVTEPPSSGFHRLTSSTRSLMTNRDKIFPRPLVKLSPTDAKPPIAWRAPPHHLSSEHLKRSSAESRESSELCLEVCAKCRQNVMDGLQHPSIWCDDDFLPFGYVRSREEQLLMESMAKKKGAKEDCRLQ